jgi:hypothetical protein
MKKPHSMWHGDVMTGRRLPNGTLIYQCTIEDDYSRGYGGYLATRKDARIVVYLINTILQWKSIPSCFHYDNGGEAKCKLVKTFLGNVSEKCNHLITFIPTLVENPKGNGKKERAHRDDKRDFWKKNRSNDLNYIRKKFEKYLKWRNEKKGHFALKGEPSITRLKENKKQRIKFTREQLENMAKVKIAERTVKPLGVVYLYNQIYHVNPNLEGGRVELWETLKGLEIRKGKRVYHLIEDYWDKRKR